MLQEEIKETCAAWIKEQTHSHHRTAEAVVMPLIERADRPADYGALLQMQYGFYHPVEQMIFPHLQTLPLPDPFFQRSALIQKDLQVLHMQPGRLSPYLPPVADALAALGVLYVLEGAALGGRIIARMLSAHAALPKEAFSFFKGREEATGAYWIRFTQFLNRQARTAGQIQAVSTAAAATCIFFRYSRCTAATLRRSQFDRSVKVCVAGLSNGKSLAGL